MLPLHHEHVYNVCMINYNTDKICTKCKRSLPVSNFVRAGYGLRPSCRDCDKVYRDTHKVVLAAKQREYWQQHPDKVRAKRRRRRVRLANCVDDGSITDVALHHLRFDIQGNRCAYCFIELEDVPHLDHIIPVSKDGEHSLRNVVWACQPCNTSKNAKLLSEWLDL